jgi:signal transduction histidine kinase
LSRLGKSLYCVGIGAALAAAGLLLAYSYSGSAAWNAVFFPETCGAGFAVVLFCLLAKESASRERAFWQLWAFGCGLWIVGLTLDVLAWPRTLRPEMGFLGLAFSFLPEVAMIAALVIQPELAGGRLRDPVVGYEAGLVALWWIYLFLLFVTPWNWVMPSAHRFWASYLGLHYLQDFALVVWLAALASGSHERWRRIYAQMACAIALLTMATGPLYQALGTQAWLPAAIYGLLIGAAFLWLALAALFNRPTSADMPLADPVPAPGLGNLLVSITVLGIPVLMIWSRFFSRAPEPVHRFRLLVSFAVLMIGVLLVYRWQDAADQSEESMVCELETSVRELRHLLGQFAETEKLASLGQLAAGAAHEINNPVAAMLGYAELLHADSSAAPRVQEIGCKIGDQARRIRTLVHNLLSFGEHATFEAQSVDVAALLRSAIELFRLDEHHRHRSLRLDVESGPIEVLGDPEKLLQVFYRFLLELAGGEGENGVEIRLRPAKGAAGAVVEFLDRGTGSEAAPVGPEPYDPQRAQQGVGFGLSVCYAIVQEHEGSIAHETLPGGRRMYRILLPASPSRAARTASAAGTVTAAENS